MLSSKKMTGIAIIMMTLCLCLPATQSYAWWSLGTSWGNSGHGHAHDRHHYSGGGRVHLGVRVFSLPNECYTVWSGGARYYYCDGYYYSRDRVDYVVVNPPVGTVLSSVPVTYQPVIINGTTYYTNNGVYYIYTSQGYQVVPAPTTTAQVSSSTDDSTFNVNIPNDKGGFTPVIIKRSGAGYVGPQGEFYAEFPKVSQLKAMYSK